MLVMKFLDFGAIGLIALVVVHWLCGLVWLSLISIIIYRTHSLWGLKFQEWLFMICGLLLIGFGAWFLVSGVQLVV